MVYLIERKRLLSYLLYTVIAAAVVLVPTSFVSAATTVGNNVSVGGTLVVTGATTLTGATWASSTFYVGSAAAGEDFVVTNNAVTVGTTVNSSTLAVYGATTITGNLKPEHNNLYDFGSYTQSWKNVYVSGTLYGQGLNTAGTLAVTGATTLSSTLGVTGATTLTGATWASSTFYVGSAAAGEDFVVTNNAVTVGTTVNSSTLAVYGNTTLTGSLLSQTGHNNLYDIGAYSAAFSDVFSSGTVYADTVTVYKVTDTSTIYVSSGAANKGGRIVLEDSDGSGCSVISMANGVLTEATVDCP
jgi:hypothetical protein